MSDKLKVVNLLCTGDFDGQDVRDIQTALSVVKERLSAEKRSSFAVDDNIEFRTKAGRLVTGVVVKVNRVSITVRASDRRQWRVAPGLLNKV